jgi:hypothetical protein
MTDVERMPGATHDTGRAFSSTVTEDTRPNGDVTRNVRSAAVYTDTHRLPFTTASSSRRATCDTSPGVANVTVRFMPSTRLKPDGSVVVTLDG